MKHVLSFLLIFAILLVSCKKPVYNEEEPMESLEKKLNSSTSSSVTCYEVLQPETNQDTAQTPTILGSRLLNNPYSLATMQQASINLYGTANGIVINKKYVRFKPANEDQLMQLINADLELFDYPLDYEVIQQGDYYDQGLPAGEIPWLYTVVAPSYLPPSGIQYEVLASLSIPDDDIYLENEAFRITGNPVEGLDCSSSMTMRKKANLPQPLQGCRTV